MDRPLLEAKAGGWSALQFLLDPDPNLGLPPIEAPRAGDVSYLGLDDGRRQCRSVADRERGGSRAACWRKRSPRAPS